MRELTKVLVQTFGGMRVLMNDARGALVFDGTLSEWVEKETARALETR